VRKEERSVFIALRRDGKASGETKKRGVFVEKFVVILNLQLADKNPHNSVVILEGAKRLKDLTKRIN